jgi:hypothetical protein
LWIAISSGGDRTDHADRLAHDVGYARGGGGGHRHVAHHLVRPSGYRAEAAQRDADVDMLDGRQRIAAIEALDRRQLFDIRRDDVGQPVEENAARRRRHLCPGAPRQSLARRPHGTINILRTPFGDQAERLAGGGIDDLKRGAAGGIDPFAADQQFLRSADEVRTRRRTGMSDNGNAHFQGSFQY